VPEAAKFEFLRLGVRLPAAPEGDRFAVLPGHKSMVYDVDSGALLPAQGIDLHVPADGVVTATITMIVSEVTVGDPETAEADGA
jgi:hypothetical protein